MFKLSKSKNINFADIAGRAENLLDSIPMVKKRRRRRRALKILKYFCYGVIGACLLLVIFFGSYLGNFIQIYNEAKAGKNNLEEAVVLMKKQDFKKAVSISSQAENNFKIAGSNLDEIRNNFFISRLTFLENQFADLIYLIKTAEVLSKALNKGAVIGQSLGEAVEREIDFSFSKFSTEEKREILQLIYESGPELNGIKASLDLAYLNLREVRSNFLLLPLRVKINKLKIQLGQARELMSQSIPMSQILPALFGYPEKAGFLVMLQNNDELRPTGGFLGTYGILETKNGDIVNFDTHDIYHMDMPVKDKISINPPEPLVKYLGVNKWFMRDANWSPDWPTSASKIEWFYKQEDRFLSPQINNFSGEFDGVIAITPEFVIDLLRITGPIIVEGVEYNKDNFVELLEYRVERGYVQLGISSWQRKEVIGEILRIIKIKLFDLPASRWLEIANAINENILKKNIFVFFKDAQLQRLVKDINLAGEVKEVEGDYLMVVDANMAALKTDAVINRNINYSFSESANGLFAKLRINYAHHGDFDWRTTRYRTYTRVYVPAGSEFIKAEGLSEGEVEISQELGKTCFGAFISIEPGEINGLYFEYKLPDNIAEQIKFGNYDLYVQRQPGSRVEELVVDLNMNNKVNSYNPIGFYVERIGEDRVRWKTDLNMDKGFSVNF